MYDKPNLVLPFNYLYQMCLIDTKCIYASTLDKLHVPYMNIVGNEIAIFNQRKV